MVVIRLSRYGKKKRPFYKIVVIDRRKSREGKFIDMIGFFNPMPIVMCNNKKYFLKININSYLCWLKKGAKPSSKVIFLYKKFKLNI